MIRTCSTRQIRLRPQSASLFLTAALAVAVSSSAFAQMQGGGREMLRQLDANGDRLLQFSEIEAMRARIFEGIDLNGDGAIDPSELAAARARREQAGQGRRRGPMVDPAQLDANRDGVISRAEFVPVPARTRAADRDGDLALSRMELFSLRR